MPEARRTARREARSADPARAGGPRPPALTGGEERESGRSIPGHGAKVDWCTVTWKPDPEEYVPVTVFSLLFAVLGHVEGVACPGMFGYESGVRFFLSVRGTPVHVGRVDFGGSHHKERARLDLSGAGCGVVHDWEMVTKWIARQWESSLTRVDLAVDCLLGEFTVDHAVEWLKAGDFKAATSGRQPRHSTPGDWLLEPEYGRTLEIGRRENGKMCRVYEKGRQLGDKLSKWTRFEVEIRNTDRELPLSILTECDRYFVGAYRCLERVLAVAGERIKTRQREGEIAIERLTLHARAAYGQLIDVLRLKLSAAEILDALSRPGVPGRLQKSSLAEFLNAASPPHYLEAKRHEAQRHRD